MDNMKCPSCGGPMKRNGRAPSGAQRWRCRSCGASATHSNDVAARELAAFVGWLLSRGTQADMPGRGRTFRRRAALFWPIWPMPEVVDEVFRVVCVLSSSRRQNRRYDFDTFGVSRADLFFYSRDLPSISAFSILLLAPPNSTSLPWCMMRSMMAEASLSSPNTTPHLLNSIFVVITRLRFS